MKKLLTTFIILSFSLPSFSQVTEITFVGYDFTHFKLIDKNQKNTDLHQYVVGWQRFAYRFMPYKKLANWLHVERVKYKTAYVESVNYELDGWSLVTEDKYSLPEDSVKKIIDRYNLKDTSGIALAVIVESFEKKTENCSMYFTFFDLKTKKIIKLDHFVADEGHGIHGLQNHWGVGLYRTFAKYLKTDYRITHLANALLKSE